jgi:hypothetical protein
VGCCCAPWSAPTWLGCRHSARIGSAPTPVPLASRPAAGPSRASGSVGFRPWSRRPDAGHHGPGGMASSPIAGGGIETPDRLPSLQPPDLSWSGSVAAALLQAGPAIVPAVRVVPALPSADELQDRCYLSGPSRPLLGQPAAPPPPGPRLRPSGLRVSPWIGCGPPPVPSGRAPLRCRLGPVRRAGSAPWGFPPFPFGVPGRLAPPRPAAVARRRPAAFGGIVPAPAAR